VVACFYLLAVLQYFRVYFTSSVILRACVCVCVKLFFIRLYCAYVSSSVKASAQRNETETKKVSKRFPKQF